jgi:CRP-like cAMP-binding protein
MHLVDSLTQADKQILQESVVFKGISLDEISPFFNAGNVEKYQPGQSVLSIGDTGKGLYIVLEGKIEVFLPQGDSNGTELSGESCKVRLDTLETGTCFGEYSLVDRKKVSASVSAINSARLFHLSTEDFFRIADAHVYIENIIYKNILKLLIARCRETNQELEEDVFLIF